MATATRKITGKAKPAAKKAVVVKLKGTDETENTWKFEYTGTAAEPFVKSLYIHKDVLALLPDGPVKVAFVPYVQTGKKKPMPVSAIRYSGDAATARDLYVNREQAEKKGFTNDSTVTVTITAATEDTISLSIKPS
jgi:hypothetical protein